MGQQKKLQMMTFIPKTSTIKVYTLGFPAAWKEKLAALAIAAKPTFNYELYILPLSSVLGNLCTNWVYGLIEISNLRKNSDDSKWIVCLSEINKYMCEEICVNLRAAALSYYDWKNNGEKVKEALDDFLRVINPEELYRHIGQDEVEIIDKDGRIVNTYAYKGFGLSLMSKLQGKTINLDGEDLILNRTGQKELMSQVLSDPNSGDLFAYVFSFSLQTIPADNQPMLLLNCSRRRFKNSTKRSQKYLKKRMSVYVKHKAETCFYKLDMKYSFETRGIVWDRADRLCYNFIYANGLPEADVVMDAIESFNGSQCDPQILCSISSENSYGSETKIGVGVGAKDEESIYNAIYELISEFVDKSPMTAKEILKRPRLNPDKELKDINYCLSRTGYKGAAIEIFYFSQDLNLAQRIKNSLDLLLSSQNDDTNFSINTEIRTLGDYAYALSKDEYGKETMRNSRIRFISDRIGRLPEQVMGGSIIILPKNESSEKDSKDLLRCGFAMTNRVTQFINSASEDEKDEEESFDCKIKNTIYDLLRQFGYSKCPTKWKDLPKYPVIAIDAITNSYSMSGKKPRAIPLSLKFNPDDRMITVESPVLNNGMPLPYYRACLELCNFSMTRDCDAACNDAVKRYVEQKIKGYENFYRENDAIILVSGDGIVRNDLWPGISNKKIATYSFYKQYCPDLIDVGSRNMSVLLNLNNSKLRVVRIRGNDEVPDYYLMENNVVSGNADGIYLYHDVFYASTAEKSQDKTYRLGDKESSISNPKHDYRGKRLIEYYPVRLCSNDEPIYIINYLNELRGLSPQFNKVTNFPLPLHYLKKIKEYFDFS